MYDIKPRAVFAHERVFRNPRAVERMNRMLDAIGLAERDVTRVTIDDIEQILDAAEVREDYATEERVTAGHGRIRQGHLKLAQDPVLVFNTFVWDESERDVPRRAWRNPHARRLQAALCGQGENFAYSYRPIGTPNAPHFVCQGGSGVHTVGGCVHKCDYCCQGFLVNIMLDLEAFCERLPGLFARQSEQQLYRYDLYTDILAFEPEYGASELLGRTFAENDKYLLLYTRSDNVRYLADLEERRHVLVNWTLSMETQVERTERDSPSLDARIEAMRFCQEHGYVVRAGFSPIIPVADWRRETTDMLTRLFEKVRPEVLRGWVLAMMDAAEFEAMFDLDIMDPWALGRMREEHEQLDGTHQAPFPLDVRAEIYAHYLDEARRLAPDVPFALCTEHPELWTMLADRLVMSPGRMFCCCGGLSVPGTSRRIRTQ